MCLVDNEEICDEEEFRGPKLFLFVVFYIAAVLALVVLFEFIMVRPTLVIYFSEIQRSLLAGL